MLEHRPLERPEVQFDLHRRRSLEAPSLDRQPFPGVDPDGALRGIGPAGFDAIDEDATGTGGLSRRFRRTDDDERGDDHSE